MGPLTVLEPVRGRLRDIVVASLGGELDDREVALGHDDGWFGPTSVAWRVHSDASLLIGGVRALLTQTMHPLAMAGVAGHSQYETDPWGRLQRTSTFLANVIYGDTACAKRHIEMVRRVHTRIVGTAPDGRAYRASDPALLHFVHITEVDAFLRAYQRFGAETLTPSDADKYVAEMATIGEALGSNLAPRSVAELAAALEDVRPQLAVGEQGRNAVRFLSAPPMEGALRVPYQFLFDAACSLLEPYHADMLGLQSARTRGIIGRNGVVGAAMLRWVLGPSPVVQAARVRSSKLANIE